MGDEGLQDFVSGYAVTPLYTFMREFYQTWIVRAAMDPVEKIIAHDFGVAVIKEAVPKRATLYTERFQAPPRPTTTFLRETASNYHKSWVEVVCATK